MNIADTVRSHFRAFGGSNPRPMPPGLIAPPPAGKPPTTAPERVPMQAPAMQAPVTRNEPAPANGNVTADNFAQQMLTLVEIAGAQDRQIQALKNRCERLERREQAGMVAFTAFFHILDANKVSNLARMAGVFGNLINQAQELNLPEDSILYLRSIETMLRDQHADDRNPDEAGEADSAR